MLNAEETVELTNYTRYVIRAKIRYLNAYGQVSERVEELYTSLSPFIYGDKMKNRKIIVDCFEIIDDEDLGDDIRRYTKKKIGTQVFEFPKDTPVDVIRNNIKHGVSVITKEV